MMTQFVHQPVFMTGDEFSIDTFSVLSPEGELYEGADEPALSRDHARRLYQAMLATRILDERMMAAQRQGRLSFYMQCTGEEAAVVGATCVRGTFEPVTASGVTSFHFFVHLIILHHGPCGRGLPVVDKKESIHI